MKKTIGLVLLVGLSMVYGVGKCESPRFDHKEMVSVSQEDHKLFTDNAYPFRSNGYDEHSFCAVLHDPVVYLCPSFEIVHIDYYFVDNGSAVSKEIVPRCNSPHPTV